MRRRRWVVLAALLPATSPAAAQEPAASDTAAADDEGWISGCVLMEGRPSEITMRVDSATGDTILIDGRKLAGAFPDDGSRYAGSFAWYQRHDGIRYRGKEYVKFAWPREVPPRSLVIDGLLDGMAVYTEPRPGYHPEIIYVPMGRRCLFQPYQLNWHAS